MKRDSKVYLLLIVVIALIILSIFLLKKAPEWQDKRTAECIGKNSELYVKEGCHACKIQEDMFGENYDELTVIDCFYEAEKCAEKGIIATPTWFIKNQTYMGVRSIEELKELTECLND